MICRKPTVDGVAPRLCGRVGIRAEICGIGRAPPARRRGSWHGCRRADQHLDISTVNGCVHAVLVGNGQDQVPVVVVGINVARDRHLPQVIEA